MAINITHINLSGDQETPEGLISNISSFRQELGAAPSVSQMHITADKVARLIGASGFKEVYIGRFRTLYCAILEKKLLQLGITTLYVSIQ